MDTFTVDSSSGKTFLVRLVREGDAWGRELKLTHAKPMPMVEFYDTEYAAQFAEANGGHEWGQLVSRYNVDTLKEVRQGEGLMLDGGVPEWYVDGVALIEVMDWVDGLLNGGEQIAMPEVPDDFPVAVLIEGDAAGQLATCRTCGRSWDDSIATEYTPVPSGRCPFEQFH